MAYFVAASLAAGLRGTANVPVQKFLIIFIQHFIILKEHNN